MKVLFVSSGNSKEGISPIVKKQGESLIRAGCHVDYFTIKGKGLRGYLAAVPALRRKLHKNTFDVIHAHYSLSGWTAVLAKPGIPIVISLMGSDVYGEYIGLKKVKLSSRYLTFMTLAIQPFVSAIISKSSNIDSFVYRRKIAHIIPNGVLLENLPQIGKNKARKQLELKQDKRYVLFLGDKKNKRKNYTLVKNAVTKLDNLNIELLCPFPISHLDVVKYLNATDVFVLASFMEGSPNVIKEAMACNCPIVATDVGDVRWVMGETPGCYITSFDLKDVADKLQQALKFAETIGRTRGRERIVQLGLDSETVAKKIINIYKSLLG